MADRQKSMYRIFALFMIVSMAISSLAYFIGFGLTSSSDSDSNTGNVADYNAPLSPSDVKGFNDIGGSLVDADFNSISDTLRITPQGVVAAQFINVEKSMGTLLQFTAAQAAQEVLPNEIYNEDVGNSYVAMLNTGNRIDYHILPSRTLNFGYIVDPNPYKGYNLLMRENGVRNVLGTPVMLTDAITAYRALDVIAGDADNAYADFAQLLNYSSSDDIIAYVDTNNSLASKLYIGTRVGSEGHADAGQGTRTVIYQDISANATTKINKLLNNETDSIEVSLETHKEEGITVVRMSADLNSLFMTEI